MTEKEYRQHPAISRSELWKIRESPQKFKWAKDHPEEPTPALLFGQLLHKLILEPDGIWDDFAVAPIVDRRTKEGKQRWKEFEEEAGERAVVTFEMVEKAAEMSAAINSEPLAIKLLGGDRERPFFWKDDLTGEECKCRCDVLNMAYSKPIIVDIKTTRDASTEEFMKAAVDYGYDFQAAMYSEGVEKNIGKRPLFVFVAVEKEPPYSINVLQADDQFMQRGYDLYREYLGTYHECKQSGNWYGPLGKSNQINMLGLPAWAVREVE